MSRADAVAAKDAAREHLRRGDLAGAAAAAERATALDPTLPAAWMALGTVRLVGGDAAAACDPLRRAVGLDPLLAEARLNLAMALMNAGRLDEAREELFAAATVDPALEVRGATERLLALSRQDFAAAPSPVSAARLAALLGGVRRVDEAVAVLDGAVSDGVGDDADLWSLRGNILLAAGRHDEALAAAERAAALRPDDAGLAVNPAGVRARQGDRAGAIAHARAAAARFPDACRPHQFLAELVEGDEWPHLLAAARATDANGAALSRALWEAFERCDWAVAAELKPRLDRLLAAGEGVNPLRLTLLAEYGPAELRRNAEAFSRAQWPARRPLAGPAEAKGRLRLGYLSADFRAHPVGTTVLDLFRHHDRARFEVRLYAVGQHDDGPEQQALAAAADGFTRLEGADLEIARRLREDDLDILVELGGHTKDARLGVLSFRPAPLQVHYLGYPGTTGAPGVDYIVGDPWTIPATAEPHFSEQPIRLPVSYLVNTPRPPAGPERPRSAWGLPEDAVVLSSFNHAHKIMPELFGVWCDILRAEPRAVLWLRPGRPEGVDNLRRAAARQGIDPSRLHFAPHVALSEHLARYRACDLMLDTTPYGAHSTAADALWMGCPLLTVAGATFAARVCAGLVDAAGLADCVARDLDDYRARALALVSDAAALAELRRRAASARDGVLFDTAAHTRWFEMGLETAWSRAVAGLPPAAITVSR